MCVKGRTPSAQKLNTWKKFLRTSLETCSGVEYDNRMAVSHVGERGQGLPHRFETTNKKKHGKKHAGTTHPLATAVPPRQLTLHQTSMGHERLSPTIRNTATRPSVGRERRRNLKSTRKKNDEETITQKSARTYVRHKFPRWASRSNSSALNLSLFARTRLTQPVLLSLYLSLVKLRIMGDVLSTGQTQETYLTWRHAHKYHSARPI